MGEEGEKKEKFLKKAERQLCWGAKDEFWACMDKAKSGGEDVDAISLCKDIRTKYETLCPAAWVVHFDRKYHYEKFKVELKKEGYKAMDEKYTNNRQTS